MKVILTAEVKGKGHEGDVVDVARGYAVNYLLPRQMAIVASAGNLKQLESRMTNISKRNAGRLSDAEAIAAAINGKSVIIEAKAGDEGKLFGSVTTLMIEEAVADQLGFDVDHKRMGLHRPIKTTGLHVVSLSVYGDVKAEISVKVVPEGGSAAARASESAAATQAEVVEEAEVPAAEAEPADAESDDTAADDVEDMEADASEEDSAE